MPAVAVVTAAEEEKEEAKEVAADVSTVAGEPLQKKQKIAASQPVGEAQAAVAASDMQSEEPMAVGEEGQVAAAGVNTVALSLQEGAKEGNISMTVFSAACLSAT